MSKSSYANSIALVGVSTKLGKHQFISGDAAAAKAVIDSLNLVKLAKPDSPIDSFLAQE